MIDLLVPPRCAGCDAAGEWLCAECRDACDPVLVRCGIDVRAAGELGGALRTAVHRFKYRSERALAGELGALVARLLARDLAGGTLVDAVVPVPLHPRRAAERGYDQTRLLAAAVSDRSGVPLAPVLHRIRWERAQVELDLASRDENVRGAFCGVAASLRGLRIALVDDVVTTGATLRAVAAAARACGARAVRAYVVGADL